MAKELLFSVTKKDLKIEYFRAGGPGGQHQNKKDTGCRITHPPSGAVGTSREHKSQTQNRKAAFRRMAESPKFKVWVQRMAAMANVDRRELEAQVDRMMADSNLKIEVGNGV